MPLLAQSGYGRAEKIQKGLKSGCIKGVILSPRDEEPAKLKDFSAELRETYNDALILFDPQFYATTVLCPRDQNLPSYDYYNNNKGLSRTKFTPQGIQRYVSEALAFQNSIQGLSYYISPTVIFEDFRDSWSQISLGLAEQAIEHWSKDLSRNKPLLCSLAISEFAFRNREGLDEFLDAISAWDVNGFYLLINRNSTSSNAIFDSTALGNILYFIHVLSRINNYEVFCGYSDWHSFILEAVGASHTACGWFQNLKNFSMSRFLPAGRARQPRKRYSSGPLLSSILINPELEAVYSIGSLPTALSGTSHDSILVNHGPAAGEQFWSGEVACLSHWETISSIASSLSGQPASKQLELATNKINMAKTLFRSFQQREIIFDPSTGPNHLDIWLQAIQNFKNSISSF